MKHWRGVFRGWGPILSVSIRKGVVTCHMLTLMGNPKATAYITLNSTMTATCLLAISVRLEQFGVQNKANKTHNGFAPNWQLADPHARHANTIVRRQTGGNHTTTTTKLCSAAATRKHTFRTKRLWWWCFPLMRHDVRRATDYEK